MTAPTGQTFILKDGKSDAGTNHLTLTPAAGNIDGAATSVINTNDGKAQVTYTGSEWSVTGSERRHDRRQITTKAHGVTLSSP